MNVKERLYDASWVLRESMKGERTAKGRARTATMMLMKRGMEEEDPGSFKDSRRSRKKNSTRMEIWTDDRMGPFPVLRPPFRSR